ncbi:MAG: potassium channel family protein [Solirubrobacterales bacterium]
MDEASRNARRGQRWVVRVEHVRDAFGLVLLLVLLTYVLTSLLGERGWDAVVICVTTGVTSIVALISAHAHRRLVRAAVWISALTVLLAAVAAASGAQLWLNVANAIQVLLLTVAMGTVLRRVVANAGADSRTILGAISVYTVLGLLFTFLYAFVARVQSGPFFEGHPHPEGSDFLFFSYTTLTTTGFGDLVPGGQPGRMLTGLEMMIGQIFLVTLVAGLVSLWRPGERLRRRGGGSGAKVPDGGDKGANPA